MVRRVSCTTYISKKCHEQYKKTSIRSSHACVTNSNLMTVSLAGKDVNSCSPLFYPGCKEDLASELFRKAYDGRPEDKNRLTLLHR